MNAQETATAAIEAAIDAYRLAEGGDGMTVDWVLVWATATVEGGDTYTQPEWLTPPNSHAYASLGLLDAAETTLRHGLVLAESDDA